MSHFNPLRRSPIKYKPRKHFESMPWRRPKIRLDGREMVNLRQDAFARSGGQCENAINDTGDRCPARVLWMTCDLAHIESRGRGGSDVLGNVLITCRNCHAEDHNGGRRLRPHKDWTIL